MHLKKYIGLGTLLIALLGGSGVFTASDFYKTINANETNTKFGYYWALLLIVAIAIVSIIILYKLAYQNIRSISYFKNRIHYKSHVCTRNDLQEILRKSAADSENSTDDEETLRLFDLHKEAFTAVKDGSNRIRGYYCTVPLTKEGEKAIKEGVFSLKKLSSSFIRANKDKYTPIYIAGVYGGDSHIVNTFILASLSESLKSIRARKVYARAQTKDGLYWLEKYDFTAVNRNKIGIGHFYEVSGKSII